MASLFDTTDAGELLTGTRLARTALAKGELVVFATDTVYGIAANAFSPAAVQRLLEAKGRDRTMPPPVLIPNAETLEALVLQVPPPARAMIEEYWPGALTLILRAQPSLAWDLGETRGTVAVRMPNHPVALELLAETGPLAVSSANLTGMNAAMSAAEAQQMLGDRVAVYLDSGSLPAPKPGNEAASTILDFTTWDEDQSIRLVRAGALAVEDLECTGNVSITRAVTES